MNWNRHSGRDICRDVRSDPRIIRIAEHYGYEAQREQFEEECRSYPRSSEVQTARLKDNFEESMRRGSPMCL